MLLLQSSVLDVSLSNNDCEFRYTMLAVGGEPKERFDSARRNKVLIKNKNEKNNENKN